LKEKRPSIEAGIRDWVKSGPKQALKERLTSNVGETAVEMKGKKTRKREREGNLVGKQGKRTQYAKARPDDTIRVLKRENDRARFGGRGQKKETRGRKRDGEAVADHERKGTRKKVWEIREREERTEKRMWKERGERTEETAKPYIGKPRGKHRLMALRKDECQKHSHQKESKTHMKGTNFTPDGAA